MDREDKLLWKIYAFILSTSLLVLALVIYNEWQQLKQENYHYLSTINQTNSKAIHGELDNITSLLHILGEQLLHKLEHGQENAAQALLDTLLAENTQLVGFGLALPTGELVLSSNNLAKSGKPINLLEQPGSAQSFRKALESDGLQVGRSYFFAALNAWIIPLRYALRDSSGEVRAVMTTGVDLESPDNVWNSQNPGGMVQFIVVRDDYYVQYINDNSVFVKLYLENQGDSQARAAEHPEFLQPYPPQFVASFTRLLQQQTGMSLDELKQSGNTIEMTALNLEQKPVFISVRFDPEYRYFSIVYDFKSKLVATLLERIGPLALIVMLFNFVLFGLFHHLAHSNQRQRAALSHQAHYDALTGLPNRHYLYEEFSNWISTCSQGFSVLFLDLDNFKDINDTHGHHIGDRVLKQVSERIQANTPAPATAIRQGGDEFILFYPGKSTESVKTYAARLIKKIRAPLQLDELEFSITSSIGIVQSPKHGIDLDELLSKADMAMYHAKRHRNRLTVFDDDFELANRRRVELEKELRLACQREEFFLVYQPKICARRGHVTGVEALLRWKNPDLGMVSPGEFIPIAESIGIITELSEFVFQQSLTDLPKMLECLPELTVSINLSPELLAEGQLSDTILRHIEQHDCAPQRVMLEVTESLFIDNITQAKSELQRLREAAVKISLDDFGTGYSSLSLLTSLPIDELKIDASFVRDILVDQKDRHLIENIISIGHNLGLITLAEGVETREQAELLTQLQCDRFQGFYFARPMPLDELLNTIQAA